MRQTVKLVQPCLSQSAWPRKTRSSMPKCTACRSLLHQLLGYAGSQQPGSRMFTFGCNFGFILGVLQTLGVPIELVKPAKWQKALSLGTASASASKTAWKNKLKGSAQRLYPRLHVTLQTADALLVLEYGRTTGGALVALNTTLPVGGHSE